MQLEDRHRPCAPRTTGSGSASVTNGATCDADGAQQRAHAISSSAAPASGGRTARCQAASPPRAGGPASDADCSLGVDADGSFGVVADGSLSVGANGSLGVGADGSLGVGADGSLGVPQCTLGSPRIRVPVHP
jgi:hypothetical protein